MKNEGACAVRTKVIGYVLAAAAALGAAQSAQAEWWGFTGSSSSPSYWNAQENWYISGNKWANFKTTTCGNMHINANASKEGVPGFASGWDKTITFDENSSFAGTILRFCAGTTSEPIIFAATSAANGLTSSGYLWVKDDSYTPDPCLEIQSGTYKFTYVNIGSTSGKTSTLVVNGGVLKTTGSYSQIGANGGDGVFTIKAGSYDNLSASNKNLTLGQSSGSSGTLNVQGGTFTVGGFIALNYNAGSKTSVINITGGVLTAGQLYLNNAGTEAGGTISIDGGTLRAYANHSDFLRAFSDPTKFHVYAGAAGATIDSDSHNITIGASIEDKPDEAGVVTFTGGGTITLSGTPSYTGGTTNVAGTVLSLTAAAKTAIMNHPVTVEIPSAGVADGTTVLEIYDGNGTFTQAEVDAIRVVGTDVSRYALVLSDEGTKVVAIDTLAGEYVWNGGASGAGWCTNGNWSKNGVAGAWYDSTAAVFENAGDLATVDSDVTAESITFRADATVAAADSGTLTPGMVVVSNGVAAIINAPTAGALVKTGAGTLTLGSSRTAQTDLTEGTLVMSGSGTVLDWSKCNFTTYPSDVPAGDVALKFENGATASSVQNIYIGNDDGATAELHKDGGDWNVSWNVVLAQGKNATARFYHRGGTMTLARYIRLGFNPESNASDTYFEISGGTVSDTRSSNTGFMSIGDSGLPGCRSVMAVKIGGSYTAAVNFLVGNAAAGTLNVEGGTVSVSNGVTYLCYDPGCTEGEDCSINITDGGTLVAKTIRHGSSDTAFGAAMSSLTFDVGTLKAASSGTLVCAHDNLTVTVGAGGGAIDSNGNVVTIEEELTGTGSMTFKGGGKVTLTHLPAYSGSTIVEAGTVLELPSAIAGDKLVFTDKEGIEDGMYPAVMITGEGMFLDDVVEKAQKAVGVGLYLSADKKTIYCVHGDPNTTSVWIGGTSSSLDDSYNWFARSVPDGGNVIIGGLVETEITNPERSSFSADFITVPSYSEAVTVDGAPISGIYAITNNSPNPIEFKNVVEFVNDIDVVQNTGAVIFTGGATGNTLARATDIYGTYTLTASGTNIVEWGGTVVKDGGAYLLPNATFFKNNGDFSVEEGGRAEVMAAKISRQSEARLLDKLEGEFKVNGEFAASASGASGRVTHYVCNGGGGGTLIVNGLRVNQNAALVPPRLPGKMVIGEGGIVRGNGYVRVYNDRSHEVGSCADWTMYHDNLGNTNTQGYVFYKHSSSTQSDLVFDTTDYYDNTIGRTITSEAPICAANDDSAAKFSVTVKGKGAFVFANTSVDSDSGKLFAGGLVVTNTATVTVNPGSRPGNGPITVHDGATLKVVQPESDALTLGGGLTLASGASLGFHFTRREVEPFLDLENTEVTFADESSKNITIRLSSVQKGASGDCIRPIAGEFALTSGGKFSGVSVSLAEDSPKWAKEVKVNDDGDIEVTITAGYYLLLR